jgi:hypothetical protein
MLGRPVCYQSHIRGGRKTATFFLDEASQQALVLLTCPPTWRDGLASGVAIQERMRKAHPGLVAECLGTDLDGVIGGVPAALMTCLPGSDIEPQWNDLTTAQVKQVGTTVIQAIGTSERLFGNSYTTNADGGCGKHFLDQAPPYANMHTYLDVLMCDAAGYANVGQQRDVVRMAELLRTIKNTGEARRLLDASPRSTFVFDLADRNILVDRGRTSGLVDMDELFTGDRWFEVALAEVYLTLAEFKHRDAYIDRWCRRWGAQPNDRNRMILYRAILGVERQARSGTCSQSGRRRPSLAPEVLEDWVDRAVRMARNA